MLTKQFAEYRKLLPTLCNECVVDVHGWESDEASGYVELISNHHYQWAHSRNIRLRAAWDSLRGDIPWPSFELNSREEAQALIVALVEMTDKVWPEPPPSAELEPTADGHTGANV